MNEEEEKRDPEEELKEETDRYHRQNQEAFDMETEYELKRKKQRKQRKESLDPDRFDSQLQTIKNVVPDLSNPKEASEFFTDMAIDAGILGRSLGEDLPGGIALVISRRLAKSPSLKQNIKDTIGLGIETAKEVADQPDLTLIQKIGKAIDQTGFTQPFKIGIRGDLLGDTTLGMPRKRGTGLKKVAPTTTRDLALYGATDDMFEDLQTTSLNIALAGGFLFIVLNGAKKYSFDNIKK